MMRIYSSHFSEKEYYLTNSFFVWHYEILQPEIITPVASTSEQQDSIIVFLQTKAWGMVKTTPLAVFHLTETKQVNNFLYCLSKLSRQEARMVKKPAN